MTATVTDIASGKQTDPRRHFIKLWRDAFAVRTGHQPTLDWGAMMKMTRARFVITDEETGEIFTDNYPIDEAWQSEINGFFRSEYARKTNYFYGFFLKQFGSFTVVDKRSPVVSQAPKIQALVQNVSEENTVKTAKCPVCEKDGITVVNGQLARHFMKHEFCRGGGVRV